MRDFTLLRVSLSQEFTVFPIVKLSFIVASKKYSKKQILNATNIF